MRPNVLIIVLFSVIACAPKRSPEDMKRLRVQAAHEAGHVVEVLAHAETFTLREATTGGVTYDVKNGETPANLSLRMRVQLAGSIAEDLFVGAVDHDGAHNDDARVRALAAKLKPTYPMLDEDEITDLFRVVVRSELLDREELLTNVANTLYQKGTYPAK